MGQEYLALGNSPGGSLPHGCHIESGLEEKAQASLRTPRASPPATSAGRLANAAYLLTGI
jgi:hypothetical protein